MKTVEVSESALESLKAMVEQLQSERDKLLDALKDIMYAENTYPYSGMSESEIYAAQKAAALIAKCTQTQSICDWQEKMNG